MIKLTDKGITTGWLSESPTSKELEKLNVEQLLIIAKRKKGLKKLMVEFLSGVKLKM